MRFQAFLRRFSIPGILAGLLCLGGAIIYLAVVRRHYPIEGWLFWRIGALFAWLGLFNLGCLGAGAPIVERLLRSRSAPGLERLALSMACGVVVFTWGMYAGGILGLFGPHFAVILPLLLAALGARQLLRLTRRWYAESQITPRAFFSAPATWFGAVAVFIVYLGVMTPDAINYDASWSHLTIGQDYAREGRLVPFPGDYYKNIPHLASILYAWAFSVPGFDPSGHWMMALHLEFNLFLWTLVALAAAISWLVGKAVRGAWSAFFLFPYIFVYDHSLGGAADHVLAFFALPVLLAARHFLAAFQLGPALLLGALLGGAALTKYQALYLAAPVFGLVLLRGLWLSVPALRRRKLPERRILVGPLVAGLATVVVALPHYLRNVFFYRNPVYPFMQRVFTSTRPVVPDGATYFENIFQDNNWVPTGTLLERIGSSLEVFATFSFQPHYSFTHGVPGFGSLFTLMLPCVLLVPQRRRLLLSALLASGGVFIWAFTFRVDRNLQGIVPLLAATTGGTIVALWRLGWAARIGVLPLVCLQLVWGGDAMFYSNYGRVRDSIDLIRSGFEGGASKRFERFRHPYRELSEKLPKNAKVLLHSSHVNLGIDRPLLLDWTGFQGLIHYGHVKTARELFDYYRGLGITHLLYTPQERAASSRQEEVLWYTFVSRYAVTAGRFGGLQLLEMPPVPPPKEEAYEVVLIGLDGYVSGLYPITELGTIDPLPQALKHYATPSRPIASVKEARDCLLDADAALFGPRGGYESKLSAELRPFKSAAKYGGSLSVYVRKD